MINRLMAEFTPLMRTKMLVRGDKLDEYGAKGSMYFYRRIQEELAELTEALVEGKTPEEIVLECADVANCCMMMADKILEEG